MREVPVELRAISKRYGGFEAVKSVSFSLMEGELCALIGENGAGKSTLIRLITGLSEPSSGTISMFGQTGRREIRSCRERLGYMPDLNASYPNLTARDNLVVRCIEWGLPTDRSIDGVLSTVGLGEAGGKKVKNFSMGMRRRLDLAIALLGDPELLILDEPTNGLDPMGIVEVRKILTHLNKDQGKTILVSSHNLEEMHKLATDYLFISHGRLIRRMTAPQLEKSCRGGFVLHVDDLELHQQNSYVVTPPDGTWLVNGNEVATADITLEGIEEKSLTATSIEFDKLPSGLYAIAPDGGLTVRLWGLSEEIEAVTAENLRVIADMSAVTGQGTVTVPVTVTISGFNDVTVRGTYELTVTVTDVAPTVPETAEGAAASHPAA